MCRLHDQGRNHIWGYYVRNLARPLWLSRRGNQVDFLIGNPPWLAFSHMTSDMQAAFRTMSQRRDLWAGAELAPHQDLSALFVVRVCELYLRKGGQFAFVMPNTAIDREHYAGFRTGVYGGRSGVLSVSFSPSWDLRRIRPHFFPRAASVVFGARTDYAGADGSEESIPEPQGMPERTEVWTGRLRLDNAKWAAASEWLTRTPGLVRRTGQIERSPYSPFFTQGATLVPRMAFMVEVQASSPLGIPHGKVSVRSSRSVQEKKPWKHLPSLSAVVESEFVRPLINGENLFPFRVGEPSLAVVPCTREKLLDEHDIEEQAGLQQWWAQASCAWDANRSSSVRTLSESLDFQSKLTKQLPIPTLRVIYNTSGMHLCCSKLRNARAIIANGLYWAAMRSEDEASYLSGVLNAPITTELTRPLMSYGKDERHIHKHVWELPIPEFDPANANHQRIARLSTDCETLVAHFAIDTGLHFAASRRHIREYLKSTEAGRELDELVFEMIG